MSSSTCHTPSFHTFYVSMEQIFQFQTRINQKLKYPISVKVNNNTSDFISVRFDTTTRPIAASIHYLFINAPDSVLRILARFIHTRGHNKSLAELLRQYVQNAYSTTKKTSAALSLTVQGKIYNVQDIFHQLDSQFFNEQFAIQHAQTTQGKGEEASTYITWFHSKKGSNSTTKCYLGMYIDELKLIKINDLLDRSSVPEYVVESVVYHEMLHTVYPPYMLPSGRKSIHTKEFKEAEKKYRYFLDAEKWLEENRHCFFTTTPLATPHNQIKAGNRYGRTQ